MIDMHVSSHFLCPHLSKSSNAKVLQGLWIPTQFFEKKLHGVLACLHTSVFRNDGQIAGSGKTERQILHSTLFMNLTWGD